MSAFFVSIVSIFFFLPLPLALGGGPLYVADFGPAPGPLYVADFGPALGGVGANPDLLAAIPKANPGPKSGAGGPCADPGGGC